MLWLLTQVTLALVFPLTPKLLPPTHSLISLMQRLALLPTPAASATAADVGRGLARVQAAASARREPLAREEPDWDYGLSGRAFAAVFFGAYF